MIARVRRVWTNGSRVTVILVEDGQTKETAAFLTLPEQELQAQLCEAVESKFAQAKCPRFVVQLAPPNECKHHHIEVIEMIHAPQNHAAETDALIARTDAAMRDETPAPDIEELYFDYDRAHGMTRRMRG